VTPQQYSQSDLSRQISLDASWLYYKVYVGRIAAGLDYLITDTVPKLLVWGEIERWFFLRYCDEEGMHLRLRLKHRDNCSRLKGIFDQILDEALGHLPRIPAPLHRPVIVKPFERVPSRRSVIRIVESVYEPEIEKFGSRGMVVAEQLFQLSSEIATSVLLNEATGASSRKTIVPILMAAVRSAFTPCFEPAFWSSYSNYWLVGAGESVGQWQPRFRAKAAELRERGVSVLVPELTLPAEIRAMVHRWRMGLVRAAAEFVALHESSRPGPVTLAFNFAHLMNNRLGILPLEEAYFATLLQNGGGG
jgi:thiopeptide-type bacteriocin biosynthesis protein